jgi:radical SAM superfamily enzyme YgiQ (UPF0313 family)
MTDLLLIETPHSSGEGGKSDVPPLGLAYIAGLAEKTGFSAEILDMNISSNRLESSIKKAGLVGISCYTHNYQRALEVLGTAKLHEKCVVIGGPHATPLYREVLGDGFDYAVRGEGEYPMVNLLKKNNDFRGLAFIQDGLPKTKSVLRVNDLDALPMPARHLMDLSRYSFPGAVATTRGCASHCVFCSSRNQSGCLRARSVKSLTNELDHLNSLGIDRFLVIDPNFAFDEKRALHFCRSAHKSHGEIRLQSGEIWD